MFVRVAFNIPQNRVFTYVVPPDMENDIDIGKRVFVPFGNRKRTGFVVAIDSGCELDTVKPILEILDDEPLFGSQDLDFYRWVADYFLYPLGKTLAEIIPAGTEKKDMRWVRAVAASSDLPLSPLQKKIMDVLHSHPDGISLNQLARKCQAIHTAASVDKLRLMGLVHIEEKQRKHLLQKMEKLFSVTAPIPDEKALTAKQQALISFLKSHGPASLPQIIKGTGLSAAVVHGLKRKGLLDVVASEIIRRPPFTEALAAPANRILFNERQHRIFSEIISCLDKNISTPFLLHGVTGSGKTEIYLKAIEQVIQNKKTALYLIPEIALTPQLISRISGRFQEEEIAILHSGIPQSVRYDQWREIRRGRIRLVIGARSAVFAPLRELKLIIVDEEHDSSYKQDERLCYNARDLAVLKAKMNNAVVILGSATPGIRTYYNAQTGKYRLAELSERVENRPLPTVELVDMRTQKEKSGKTPLLSERLICEISRTLKNEEQVLLFLNKRGFDTFLVCAECGYHFRCPNCAVSLKHHLADQVIKCHYCGYQQKALPVCPACRGRRITPYGAGTQKLERDIKKLFPQARVGRMDADASSSAASQENILVALQERKIDILIGTQMIAKGHDFPWITLVGVVSADIPLNLPDFRAAEKTFQILTQVAGRGGRGDNPGKVIIQTFNPQHFVLRHVQNHNYQAFYQEELSFRRQYRYPPFTRIINIRLSSTKKDEVSREAELLGKKAHAARETCPNAVDIIGPAPAPLAKLNGRYRFQLLLKGFQINALRRMAQDLLQSHKNSFVKVSVDIDPDNFM